MRSPLAEAEEIFPPEAGLAGAARVVKIIS